MKDINMFAAIGKMLVINWNGHGHTICVNVIKKLCGGGYDQPFCCIIIGGEKVCLCYSKTML
ncbi:MAG: hypothetical protein N3I35_11860 [Clostridia bacterium]|nr:hypothetical protein [Clostridia bacterium]